MTILAKNRRLFRTKEDLFSFARAYLSEGFPNPERAGCPSDQVLGSMARSPAQADLSTTDHLTSCSPCFNAYAAHLEQARLEAPQSRHIATAVRVRRLLLSAASALVLLVVLYTVTVRRHNAPLTTDTNPVPTNEPGISPKISSLHLDIDLTSAGLERGHQYQSRSPAARIPAASAIDLSLRLPIGAEANRYNVSLISNRRTEWHASALAHLDAGQMVLNMHADLSQISGGRYDLIVTTRGLRLTVPVVITTPLDKERYR